MSDLLDMDFSYVEKSPKKEEDKEKNDDLLLEAFAKLGLNLNEETKQESADKKDSKQKTEDKRENLENKKKDKKDTDADVSNFLTSVALPDFNTKDHKIKRIIESVPDFDWLIGN